MLKEVKPTNGIGARIAHNIPCTSTQDALVLLDRVMVSAANVKKKKPTITARRKDQASRGACPYFSFKDFTPINHQNAYIT